MVYHLNHLTISSPELKVILSYFAKKTLVKSAFLCFLIILCAMLAEAQCIYINEVLINGPSNCDGNCNPNTEEWVELYNDCATPVDISCFTLTDGDFTVTFPVGTFIQPNGFLTIGSDNSGIPVDINLASCNCAAGAGIGTYTNANEQIILVDVSGQQVDAVYWGAGQFPVSISTTPANTCAPQTISVSSPTTSFTLLPGGGNNGCSIARICDGAPDWEERCGSAISGQTSNGASALSASFSGSQLSICTGTCIDFTDNSIGSPTSWEWIFEGASVTTSSSNEPTNICYDTPGSYDVTLIISNTCGSDTLIEPAYISVQSGSGSNILIAGNLTFCQGGNTTLSVPAAFSTYQWFLNGQPISGANSSFYTTQEPGSYYISVSNNSCITTSNTVIVSDLNVTEAIISSSADTLCPGDVASLLSVNNADSYQWLLDGNVISGQNASVLSISEPGAYQLITISSQDCQDTSMIYTIINAGSSIAPISSQSGTFTFCDGDSITLLISDAYTNYQWNLLNNPLPGATTNTLVVTEPGTYSVSLSANGCDVTLAPVLVTVNPLPVAVITFTDTVLCSDEIQDLQSASVAANYQWFFNGTAVPVSQQILSVGEPGTYQLIVTDALGCSAVSDLLTITATSLEPVTISYDSLSGYCLGDELLLSASPSIYSSYSWFLNGDLLADDNVIAAVQSGNYNLVAGNADDCFTTASVELQFNECGSLYFPSAFTPNGDGINDLFRPLGTDVSRMELWVYNRYGQLIYYTDNKNIGWDGTFNMQPVAIGVYVFHFEASDSSGNPLTYKGKKSGNVTVLR